METLSRTYGWTPGQIKEMDVQDVQNYLDIIGMRNQIEKAEAKKAKRK